MQPHARYFYVGTPFLLVYYQGSPLVLRYYHIMAFHRSSEDVCCSKHLMCIVKANAESLCYVRIAQITDRPVTVVVATRQTQSNDVVACLSTPSNACQR